MLSFTDYREHPKAWADKLNISLGAVELYLESEVIDLHVDSFLWPRLLPGYNLTKRHKPRLPYSAFLNQVDLPRTREAQMAAMCWDIVTNPFRPARKRVTDTQRHIASIKQTLAACPEDFVPVRNLREYRAAREKGLTAGFISLQGGQALDYSLESLDTLVDDWVHRITVVHMTSSRIGHPNNQVRKNDRGLTKFGVDFVRRMQEKRILVDLSHINRKGFFDVVAATDPAIPLMVTHTGVNAVRSIWRNIDDDQIRVVAERGGTIGVIYSPMFLDRVKMSCPLVRIVDHLQHIIDVVGDDHASLGSDYDGMIALPFDLPDITYQPRLVEEMLHRRWSDQRIKKILGTNFLRVLGDVRPE